jgi:hypothetical protein
MGEGGNTCITDGADPGTGSEGCHDVGIMKMLRVLSGKSPSSKVNLRRHAEQVAEEKFCSLSDAWTNGARRLVVSKMEHRE